MAVNRWVVALILALVLLNLFTIEIFPIVWNDEVMFVEPAWNLAQTGFMNSRAWYFQDETQWWVGNAPLHSLLLAVWLKVHDIGILQARSFGLLEYALAVWVLLVAAASLQPRPSAMRQALFVLIAFLAYSATLNYRSGRYDPTGILLVSLVCLGMARGSGSWLRGGLLGLGCAVLVPLSGVHVFVFFMLLLAVLFVVAQSDWRPGLVALGVAASLGAGLWMLIYAYLGLFEPFFRSVRFLKDIEAGAYSKDPSLYLLVAATLVLVVDIVRRSVKQATADRRLLVGTLLLVVIVPTVFLALGRFPTYYSWMLLLPLGLLLSHHGQAFGSGRGLVSLGLIASRGLLLVAALLVGLPLQLLSGHSLAELRAHDRVVELAQSSGNQRSSPMLVSSAAWYASLLHSERVFVESFDAEHRLLNRQQLNEIKVVLLAPNDHAQWIGHLGGEWEKLGEIPDPDEPVQTGLFRRGFGEKLSEHYRLGLYRRVEEVRGEAGVPTPLPATAPEATR
jgi:4-amino-4-deoxy-L-arabinose transferase-like glycosyltransferase